jgi:hypothetical protein
MTSSGRTGRIFSWLDLAFLVVALALLLPFVGPFVLAWLTFIEESWQP